MTSLQPSTRPTYAKGQLHQYFEYIGLEQPQDIQSADATTQLEFLADLVRHQLCKVPFENLDLHYAPVRGISLNASHLFDKIVKSDCGRGGYCMQNNSFFGTILRSLGFSVMSTGGRVSTAIDDGSAGKSPSLEVNYGSFGHQINIISLPPDGRKFFCDVGFGSSGPTFPVPLREGFTAVNTGTPDKVASSMKLVRGFAANNTHRNPEQELWIYCIKYGTADDESKPWIPCYSFSETEFFPADFDMMSNWVSTSRSSIFVRKVICTKFLMGEDGKSLIGDITLNDDAIKERKHGVNKDLAQIKSEEDRVTALERHMGLRLSEAEAAGIRGSPTAIQ